MIVSVWQAGMALRERVQLHEDDRLLAFLKALQCSRSGPVKRLAGHW